VKLITLLTVQSDVVDAPRWPNCYSKSRFRPKWCVFLEVEGVFDEKGGEHLSGSNQNIYKEVSG